MSLKCISLGKINKYIFLVLVDSIINSSLYYFELQSKYFYSNNDHPIVCLIIYSFGLCLSISLLLINKICSKRKRNIIISQENNLYISNLTKIKMVSKKEKFLWILLVSIIDFIFNIINNYYLNEISFSVYSLLFCFFFLSLFSYKILNHKLYKHHYLCIIILSISSFILTILYIFIEKKSNILFFYF